MTRTRYSAEIIFGIGSISSTFLDVTRDMYFRMDENKNAHPQPTMLEDNIHFAKYIKNLCDHANELFACEQKMIKINAPAIVFGDLCGDADSLFTLERLFWQSVPVLANNLVFLGNYMGGASTGGVPGTSGTLTSFNIEIFCYLLALKLAAPNKVFLLRGVNETADHIGRDLMAECALKYGPETGIHLFTTLIDVMNKLPFAVVIDETILCTHSGIPRTALKLAKFLEIPDSVSNVANESPLAYEVSLHMSSGTLMIISTFVPLVNLQRAQRKRIVQLAQKIERNARVHGEHLREIHEDQSTCLLDSKSPQPGRVQRRPRKFSAAIQWSMFDGLLERQSNIHWLGFRGRGRCSQLFCSNGQFHQGETC